MTMTKFVKKYLKIDPINGAELLPDVKINNRIYSVTFSGGTYADPKIVLHDIDADNTFWIGNIEVCPFKIDRIEAIRTSWSL